MKISCFCLFFVLFHQANAQMHFGQVECDSFHVTIDTTEAIIYKKKKSAVYNRIAQQYLIKPTKASIFKKWCAPLGS